MKCELRDLLEGQIISDANQGDTTVLASLLELLTDEQIHSALGDKEQEQIKCYYDVHVSFDGGGYSIAVITPYPMEDQRIIDIAIENDQFEDDEDDYNVDSIEQLTFENGMNILIFKNSLK